MVLSRRDFSIVTTLLLVAMLLQAARGSAVAEGRWGGVGAALRVSGSGGELEFDCAHGSLGGPLVFDSEGRFDVPGVFVRERPGPIREGEPGGAAEKARYRGRMDGDTVTLEVLLPGSGKTFGPFTLKRGASTKLHRCL